MLIKEYRICMPLTVEEYRIAQLYMIQKKSRVESTGAESGIEILKNEPYQNEDGESGQYTYKVYHIGSHLPAWLRSLLPQSALRVDEEAWNAYPYTKTCYRAAIMDKFRLEIETRYIQDDGRHENVFHLSKDELKNRVVDYVDFVADPIADYIVEEDPRKYVSKKTGRGPLSVDWRQQCAQNPDTPIMCAYKLCRVEFAYWGMQNKIERFIHDVAIRKTLVRAHRQVWAWQDEWHGLSMADIRRLEAETARALALRMGGRTLEEIPSEQQQENEASSGSVLVDTSTGKERRVSTVSCAREILPSTVEVEAAAAAENAVTESAPLVSNCDASSTYSTDESEDMFYDAEDMYENEPGNELPTHAQWNSIIRSSSWDGLLENSKSNDKVANTNSLRKILILVVHGGSLLDTSHEYHNKNVDVTNFRVGVDTVLKNNYPHMFGKVSVRLVACPPVVRQTLHTVASLNPFAYEVKDDWESVLAKDFLPLGAIPLFFSSTQSYEKVLETVCNRMNEKYTEFLHSEESEDFQGDVCVVGDCSGAVIFYDLLCRVSEKGDLSRSDSGTKTGQESTDTFTLSPTRPTLDTQLLQSSDGDNESVSKFTLNFKVRHFFMLGSPLALVMAFRRNMFQGEASSLNSSAASLASTPLNPQSQSHFQIQTQSSARDRSGSDTALLPHIWNQWRPVCEQVYNLFYSADPSAFRIEPLLCPPFRQLPPVNVGRCRLDPGEEEALTGASGSTLHFLEDTFKRHSILSQFTANFDQLAADWWGDKRVDYSLFCPDILLDFPVKALPHLLYSSYWESLDCAAFILRQMIVARPQMLFGVPSIGAADSFPAARSLTPTSTKYSSFKKRLRDTLKIKRTTPNHRANDVLVLDGQPQVLRARFMYGPLDVVPLSCERVHVHIRSQLPDETWHYYGHEMTDSTGRVSFIIPEARRLPAGVLYPVRMSVWEGPKDREGTDMSMEPPTGATSAVEFTLAVLNPRTEAVVFSVDGSFAASVSLLGKDPKVRPGSVDMARHWQSLGYLLVYVTARPAMQYRHVLGWLAQHNFPLGLCQFSEGLSTGPLRNKAMQLAHLVKSANLRVHCAYGSAKDIPMYRDLLKLPPERIFVVGSNRMLKKAANGSNSNLENGSTSSSSSLQATVLTEGYSGHLTQLCRANCPLSRPAVNRVRCMYRRSTFQPPLMRINSGSNDGSQNLAGTPMESGNGAWLVPNEMNRQRSASSFHTSEKRATMPQLTMYSPTVVTKVTKEKPDDKDATSYK